MAADAHALLFVHLGAGLPHWLGDTLAQACLFNTCPVYLAAESASLKDARLPAGATLLALEEIGLSPKHQAFREVSVLDSRFRGGFWTYTTERFFVLESAMARLGLGRVVHLENDMLLYAGLDDLVPRLAPLYPAIAATFDNDKRCVPGFFYIAGLAAIARLTDYLLAVLSGLQGRSPETLRGINDMALLGEYRKRSPDAIDLLPIVPPDYPAPLRSAAGHLPADPCLYSRHYEALGMIFDAAALGQYLGGVDPRNYAGPSRGFVNESCLFDARIVKPRMMMDADGLRRPVIETPSGTHLVANLHIHAKDMKDFLSHGPGA